jgi:uncharacterized integral membrane protein
MNEIERDEMWTNLWWLSRVIVGYIIHIVLIIFALYNVDVVYELVINLYIQNPEQNVYIPAKLSAAITACSSFFASMAGVFWVKQQYVLRCLPELMDELSKKLNLK